jgi:hypothetical protein
VRLLALVVRKGSNFECVFCGLSPHVSEGGVASLHLYLLTSSGSLGLQQPHPAQEVSVAGVGVQAIEFGINLHVRQYH